MEQLSLGSSHADQPSQVKSSHLWGWSHWVRFKGFGLGFLLGGCLMGWVWAVSLSVWLSHIGVGCLIGVLVGCVSLVGCWAVSHRAWAVLLVWAGGLYGVWTSM